MEDSVKKPIMIVVIVVCLAGTGLLLFKGGPEGGVNSIPEGEMKWVKCNNPACNAEYETSARKYFKEFDKNVNPNPMAPSPTAVTCKECGKLSVYAAIKCPNVDCGKVFIEHSSGPNDYGDRCPECGKSEIEDRPKRRQAGEQ
ncbi:MAG: hypothetical protein ACYSWQ_05720 [Planctomycetota bacterium]|jgi:hypothetical protein